MKIYDISQRIFGCRVFEGDPKPKKVVVSDMEKGDLYNLTEFSMCAHNGTHIDAPAHFLLDGATVDCIPLENTVGLAYVCSFSGEIGVEQAKSIIKAARQANAESAMRIVIKGNVLITDEGASAFAGENILLLGVEGQSVGDEKAPMSVHKILLKKGVTLLEGLDLSKVFDGVYLLSATPLNLNGCEGAPCRAVLIEL